MRIKNPHNIPCSFDECTSIWIARQRDWICGTHLQMEYNNRSTTGQKNWNSAKKKPTRPMSAKRVIESKIYSRTRIEFLSKPENMICFIDGCPKPATTIEHTAGRIGSKYLDQEFWKPCCQEHNQELENNSKMSNQYQLSKTHGGKKLIKDICHKVKNNH